MDEAYWEHIMLDFNLICLFNFDKTSKFLNTPLLMLINLLFLQEMASLDTSYLPIS